MSTVTLSNYIILNAIIFFIRILEQNSVILIFINVDFFLFVNLFSILFKIVLLKRKYFFWLEKNFFKTFANIK